MTGDVTGPKFRRGFPFREALQEAIAQTGNPRGDAQLTAASRRLDRWVPGRTAGSKDAGDDGLYAAFRSCLEKARVSHLSKNESLSLGVSDERDTENDPWVVDEMYSWLAQQGLGRRWVPSEMPVFLDLRTLARETARETNESAEKVLREISERTGWPIENEILNRPVPDDYEMAGLRVASREKTGSESR